jgi:hypothetical protein
MNYENETLSYPQILGEKSSLTACIAAFKSVYSLPNVASSIMSAGSPTNWTPLKAKLYDRAYIE